jgi:phosphoribosylaminoimidazole-succinocarboxamide synthase
MKIISSSLLALSLLLTTPSFADILAEGKTKIVRSCETDPTLAFFEAKDDITAFNGLRHDILEGKKNVATQTTCNVFRLLKDCNLPIAFKEQINSCTFLGDLCEMIQYEVIVRREAHGSYLKRNPHLTKGHLFPELIVEFFLKTSNHNWQGQHIPEDDPFIQFTDLGAELYLPSVPVGNQEPFLTLSDYPLKGKPELFEQIALIAKQTFLALEKAWQLENGRLVDFKVEFGLNANGDLLLADVIDNDSWRVVQNQQYVDKQFYRDGGQVDDVLKRYHHVSATTGHFQVPNQQIILWRQSESDDLSSFLEKLAPYVSEHLKITEITAKSVDKEVQMTPDSVLILCSKKEEGIDEALFSNLITPKIAAASGWDQSPTVDKPQDAALAALQMLASRNPQLYMQLRIK